jgi:hypothetical protein
MYKSASFGLKSLEKESKNGTKLMSKLAFTPEN